MIRPTALIAAAALASAAFLMSGCSGTQAAATAAPAAPAGTEFPWAAQSIDAAGRGNAPANIPDGPQRAMAGKQAAKTVAVTALLRQVSSLPVTEDHTVGYFMEENLGIKRAVETHVQSAQPVSDRQVSPGVYEVRAQVALKPVADILRQYHITPSHLPPPPPGFEGNAPRVI